MLINLFSGLWLLSLNYTLTVPVIYGPCQGCELAFIGMPNSLSEKANIVTDNERGEPMELRGIVTDRSGNPAAGIVIYAYQTDNDGHYPKGETVHGKLRAWARTNELGQYSFKTVRPQAYPNRDIPQHIHLHVIEPGKGTYYIDSVEFTDDPLLTDEIENKRPCRGGCGVVTPVLQKDNSWLVIRNIELAKMD